MLRITQKYPLKRAFITGAASGLGYRLCILLAADGWTIGMADRDGVQLMKAAANVKAYGAKVYAYEMDVSDKVLYADVAEEFLDDVGGIDLLINNAGVAAAGSFEELSTKDWEWLLGTNQMGVIYGTHCFLPAMKKQQKGHIINIASAAAFVSMGSMSAYNMSKASILSLSETLKAELEGSGLSVSVLMSGFFRSRLLSEGKGNKASVAIAQRLVREAPIGTDEVAEYLLRKAAAGKLYILYPAREKWMWRLKRYFPGLWLWVMRQITKNKDKAARYLLRNRKPVEEKKRSKV